MGGLEDQLRALEDPAPASEGALALEDAVATEPTKRKLPFRGDLTLHAKKYKGRRVSRGEAELEPQDFGVTSDFEVEDVEGAGSSSDENEESEDEGSMSEAERSGEEGEEFERPALVLREDELKEEEAAVAKRLADAEAKEERRAVAVREQKVRDPSFIPLLPSS